MGSLLGTVSLVASDTCLLYVAARVPCAFVVMNAAMTTPSRKLASPHTSVDDRQPSNPNLPVLNIPATKLTSQPIVYCWHA